MRTVLLAVTVINLAVVGPFFVGLPALVDSFDSGPLAYGSCSRPGAGPR